MAHSRNSSNTQGYEACPAHAAIGEMELCHYVYEKKLTAEEVSQDHRIAGIIGRGTAAKKRAYFDEVIQSIGKFIDEGKQDNATALLEEIACWRPDFHTFSLTQEKHLEGHDKAIQTFLSRLTSDKMWINIKGYDNLKASIGMIMFNEGCRSTSLDLLQSVRWNRINCREYYIHHMADLYWSGGAPIIENMTSDEGFQRNRTEPRKFPAGSSVGHFCAIVGKFEQARQWLLPYTDSEQMTVSGFMSISQVLLDANCISDLREFLDKDDTGKHFEAQMDNEQRERYYTTLFNAGFHGEASQGFQSLLEIGNGLPIDFRARLIYSLAHTNPEQAERFLHEASDSAALSTSDLIYLTLAAVGAGFMDKARQLYDQIDESDVSRPLQAKYFDITEQLSKTDRLPGLFEQLLGDPPNLSHNSLVRTMHMSAYEKDIDASMAMLMENEESTSNSITYLHTVARLSHTGGDFARLKEVIQHPLLRGEGYVAYSTYVFSAYSALADNDLPKALGFLEKMARFQKVYALVPNNFFSPAFRFVDYVLLLRAMGNTRKAFEAAQESVQRIPLKANACRPLMTLLQRELDGTPVTKQEAQEFEATADRFPIMWRETQGLLYLFAIAAYVELGQFDEATRVLQTRLATTPFLDETRRQELLTADSRDLDSLSPKIQKMFYPNFQNTYWNKLIHSIVMGTQFDG